ncbi:MAG: EVE domain-containing protein [Nitrospirota bacterium]|jgi:predicted RNA-binding protein with PUA-like domain
MTQGRRYWLLKSEPRAFSIDDLARAPRQTTCWDGVRNYQARNFMRAMAVGDLVLFYHSNAEPPAVVGIAEVVRMAYPDKTQFDKTSHHYDPASMLSAPRWDMVDIRYRQTFKTGIPLDRLKREAQLKGMVLLQKGSRLSVQPVMEAEWAVVLKLAGVKIDSRKQ